MIWHGILCALLRLCKYCILQFEYLHLRPLKTVLWLRHWHCHMTKQAAHRQKTRQLDGNKYRLLISDQFYLSGRYVKKWLTSADKDITADISCIPIYFACLFQQLTSLLHQNLQVGMHYFHQLHKWQHANLLSSVLVIW